MKLYKYRKFSEFLIRELCSSQIYYADPKLFNDPLDCSSVVIDDLGKNDLEKLCFHMLIKSKGVHKAKEIIDDFRFYSQQSDGICGQNESYIYSLRREVKNQLDDIMKNKGVLSLSSKFDSPLMWSHYADEHKGVCLGFKVESPKKLLREIDYEGMRGISAKLIMDYVINQDDSAYKKIEEQYFFTKAKDWKYESEWRSLSSKIGESFSEFELSSIYFGTRCDNWVINAIVKLLYKSGSEIEFYKMHLDPLSFELHKRPIEPLEIINSIPRQSPVLAFREKSHIKKTSK